MKRLIVLASALMLASCSKGVEMQESYQKYDINYFTDERILSVVREYDTEIDFRKDQTAVMHYKKAVTIMNEEASELGEIAVYYNKFEKVSGIKGAVFDINGNEVKSLGSDDIIDASASGGISISDDNRLKYFELTHYRYPYTIVYEYTKEYSSLLNVPAWYIQNPYEYVENASLRISYPKELNVRSYESNFEGGLIEDDSGEMVNKEWTVKDLDSPELESYSLSYSEQVPRILLAVDEFSMEGTEGSLVSWTDFGQWYHDLSEGRDMLSDQTKADVDELLMGVESDKEKARILYDYMQKRTRYVSIQLGIGGWQTFPASFVEDTGYGDCKALTNFMFSLLKYADVTSYPVLIRNGSSEAPLIDDFPSNQFNHVILYIPRETEEDIWLECTSQKMPFGYIGTSNSDRLALKITDKGSELIRTPVYDHDEHRLLNTYDITLSEDGSADIDISSLRSGYFYDQALFRLSGKSQQDKREWLNGELELNTYDVNSFDFKDLDRKVTPVNLSYNISSRSFSNKTGSRLFIPVNVFNKWGSVIRADSSRQNAVYFPYAFTEADSTIIHIPKGYEIESAPEPVTLDEDFAFFNFEVDQINDEELKIIRRFILTKEKVPADQYDRLRTFLIKIINKDKENLVLVRKS